ncbi:MAG: acyltransferase family protein [Clostridiales bacterium]|nr:acyltransferase family protein [Clostridiales bacterium]
MTEKEIQTVKHEHLPDILRGFAVFLMVFGHCIQEGSGLTFRQESLYFEDKLYQFIYSFHMPLFMLLSGYLAWGSLERAETVPDRIRLLKRRSAGLLLPIAIWTLLEKIYAFVFNRIMGYPNPSFMTQMSDYLKSFLTNFWFLWAVFWCFLIVYIMHYYLHDSIPLYVLGFLALFFLPDGMGLGAYKYMLPYYIAAFYFHGMLLQNTFACAPGDSASSGQAAGQNGSRLCQLFTLLYRHPLSLLLVSGGLFLFLFSFYTESSFIYLSGYKLIGKDITTQLFIDLHRTLIGFAGCVFFILLWKSIMQKLPDYRFPVMTLLGRNSLGIYLTSGYLTLFGIMRFSDPLPPSYLRNFAETLAVLAGSVLLTGLFGRLPILRVLVGRLR